MRSFVGRERELAALGTALDGALSGRGQAVVLAGEPGIGKTCTVQAFSATAVERGAAVLWGRCHQEPGAPPYWPWLQILRRFTERLDDSELRAALGSGAGCVAEIYPELKDRLAGVAAPQKLADAGQARFRLSDALAEFWKRAAATQPLVLIFEDPHCRMPPPSTARIRRRRGGRLAHVRRNTRDAEISGRHVPDCTGCACAQVGGWR